MTSQLKSVGIKALRDNLSRYIEAVKGGARILVTEHDQVVAELAQPLTPIYGQVSRWHTFLNQLNVTGKLTQATRQHSQAAKIPLSDSGVENPEVEDVMSLLKETRADKPFAISLPKSSSKLLKK
jgi:antitoxin (DNA-binding transcriptional repressor) of toxin-antitoxin stability system